MLAEIEQIEKRIQELGPEVRVSVLAQSEGFGHKLPIYCLEFGSQDPKAPVLGITGGVHGLERIGSQVAVALLNSFSELLKWDRQFQQQLQKIRVFFIPTVNPIGILKKRRSNPRGIDLMRNAPLEAEAKVPFLLGGHRYGDHLPWYRGPEGAAMELEAQALVSAVQKQIQESRVAVTVDLHSGFGWQDRLWFPWAKSLEPFPQLPEMKAFKDLFEQTHPHHFYKIEPQAQSYTTHGDLWDYLYQWYLRESCSGQAGVYLPLCLEMGSWMWVKKNPWQFFRAEGFFNPVINHRHQRTLRRHHTLFEYLLRAVANAEVWSELSPERREALQQSALKEWYSGS